MHYAFRSFVFATLTFAALPTTVRGDTVYALSNSDGRIVRYDSTNPAGTVVTLSGTGLIVSAAGLALGPDGNLYIGEGGDGAEIKPSIRRLNLTNNTLSTVYTFEAEEVIPAALVFKGNDLLVGRSPFPQDTGAIVKVTDATGNVISTSDYTTGGSLASSPGLAIGADGSLYVSDQTYNFISGIASGPVKKFDALGAYVGEFIASGSSGLAGPTGLGIRGNTLYTASIMNGSILQTNLLDNSTTLFGSTGVPFGASPLALLSGGGLIVGSAGGSGLIYQFDGAGTLTGSYSSGLGMIGGVVVAPVPEPATLVTAAIGLAGALAYGRRRSGRQS